MSINKTKLVKSLTERGRFAVIPNELWEMDISVKAKTTYCFLIAQSEGWNPGLRGIAKGINMAVNSARAAVKELEDAGMLEVEESPNGLRNIYSFTPVTAWVWTGVSTGDTVEEEETVSDSGGGRATGDTPPYQPLIRHRAIGDTHPRRSKKNQYEAPTRANVSEESFEERTSKSKSNTAGSPSVSKQEADWMATYLTDDWMRDVYSRITDDSWKAHCFKLSEHRLVQSFLKTVEKKLEIRAMHGLG